MGIQSYTNIVKIEFSDFKIQLFHPSSMRFWNFMVVAIEASDCSAQKEESISFRISMAAESYVFGT